MIQMTIRTGTNFRAFIATNMGMMGFGSVALCSREHLAGLGVGVTDNAVLTVIMVDPIACVCMNERLSVAYLTNTIIGVFATDIGPSECYLLGATVGRLYLFSHHFEIGGILTKRSFGWSAQSIVADSAILNMVNFGKSSPRKANHGENC